ncbi:MAG: cyclodeaminase/cyclohydrolase family protein [Oscillospiraceae bacterium]|jgi:formiminotetrahydrofolate cyclodeaminase
MRYITCSMEQFTEELASKAAVPGGGGASALVGAVGAALGAMVGNLTVGKKKYAAVESEIQAIIVEIEAIRKELLRLVDADAEAFLPLSKAYGIPKDDPIRTEVMESALRLACSVPMDLMRTLGRAIELHEILGQKGSRLALSDVGVGVLCCKTALQGASLNVWINTKSMTDRNYAETIEAEAEQLLQKYSSMADRIYADVLQELR